MLELRAFSPLASFIYVIRRLFVCEGGAFAALLQSQPNIFAVTVIVVALGRSLYFISFPAASYE